MGNCCSDNHKSEDKGEAKKQPKKENPKALRISGIDENSASFGFTLNGKIFTLTDEIRSSIRKFGLYKFEQSSADLKGTEINPVKTGQCQDFVYQGQFAGTKPHGKGHYQDLKTKDLYICPFLEGKSKGTGAVYFSNGDYFFGKIKEDGLDSGKMTYADGTIYTGDFKGIKRDGRGTYLYPDGTKYEGLWEDDCEHGLGRIVIDGTWLDGKRVETFNPIGGFKKDTEDSLTPNIAHSMIKNESPSFSFLASKSKLNSSPSYSPKSQHRKNPELKLNLKAE